MARRNKRSEGFLKPYSLLETYLLKPDVPSGRPGLIEGAVDGDNVLVKLWPKKAKQQGADLEEIWKHELRQLSRLSGHPDAGDYIAGLRAAGEDSDAFYLILEAGPRRPLETLLKSSQTTHWLRSPRTQAGRLRLWLNLARISSGLETIHSQGLLHRNIDGWSILTSGSEEPDFQLTGFEWSMRISASKQTVLAKVRQSEQFDSFRSDWAALGRLFARLLGAQEDRLFSLDVPPSEVADHLDALEVRILRQMCGVEPTDRMDGDTVRGLVSEVVRRLEQGIAQNDAQYRLVVRLGPQSPLSADIRKATGGRIELDETDAQMDFIRADLTAEPLLVAVQLPGQSNELRYILKGQALAYRVGAYRPFRQDPTWDFAYCDSVERNPPHVRQIVGSPHKFNPSALKLMTSPEAGEAFHRLRKRVASWNDLRNEFIAPSEESLPGQRLIQALALTQLVEMAFSVSDIFAVKVIDKSAQHDGDDQHLIRIESREDADRDAVGKVLNLKHATERLEQLLELDNAGEEAGWTLTDTPSLGERAAGESEWTFQRKEVKDGKTSFLFAGNDPPIGLDIFLVPSASVGTIVQFKRRLKALASLSEHLELRRMLSDPRSRLTDSQESVIADEYFGELDDAKQAALRELVAVLPLFLVQGPPGVGKTYLVRELVRRRFAEDPTARLLLTAQSHAAIDHLMSELKALLIGASGADPLIVRCRKKDNLSDVDPFDVREQAADLLRKLAKSQLLKDRNDTVAQQIQEMARDSVKQASPDNRSARASKSTRSSSRSAFEGIVLRAANVVFATTNAPELERLIDERGQFDWSIVEESGKATGGELVAPLMLSHRRLLIGDHKQLPPYRSEEMRRVLESETSVQEIVKVAPNLISRTLRGPPVDELLEDLQAEAIADLGPIAVDALLMFQTLIESEFKNQREKPRAKRIASKLTVQHRMHPEIAELVSGTFYDGELTTHPSQVTKFKNYPAPICFSGNIPEAPITVVTLPDIQQATRKKIGDRQPPWWNPDEVDVVCKVLEQLRPLAGEKRPTLAVLSPYARQVKALNRDIGNRRGSVLRHLDQFRTANGGTSFCSTVDAFQGSEADVVIVSLVRNNPFTKPSLALGFLRDLRRMNVLLSRAKWKLVLVGSLDFLRSVVEAMPADPGPKYRFLKELMRRLDAGITSGTIKTIAASDLVAGGSP